MTTKQSRAQSLKLVPFNHFSHNGLQFSIETEPLRKVRVDDKNPNKNHAECDYKPANLVENSTEPKR